MKKKPTKKTVVRKKRPGQWIDKLVDAVGRNIHLETMEGVFREGKLTGLRMRDLEMNGKRVDYPEAIEFNGDPTDYIDFVLVRRITID